MIYSVPGKQALRAYIVITYFGPMETNISCKNVVHNLALKHCYLYSGAPAAAKRSPISIPYIGNKRKPMS